MVNDNMAAAGVSDEHQNGVRQVLEHIFDTFVHLERRKGGGGRGGGSSSSSSSKPSGGGSGGGSVPTAGAGTSDSGDGDWFLHPDKKRPGLYFAAGLLWTLIVLAGGAVSLVGLLAIYIMVSEARDYLKSSGPNGFRVLLNKIRERQDSDRRADVELGQYPSVQVPVPENAYLGRY